VIPGHFPRICTVGQVRRVYKRVLGSALHGGKAVALGQGMRKRLRETRGVSGSRLGVIVGCLLATGAAAKGASRAPMPAHRVDPQQVRAAGLWCGALARVQEDFGAAGVVRRRRGGQLELHVTALEAHQRRLLPVDRRSVGRHLDGARHAGLGPRGQHDAGRLGVGHPPRPGDQVTLQVHLMDVVVDEADVGLAGRLGHVVGRGAPGESDGKRTHPGSTGPEAMPSREPR